MTVRGAVSTLALLAACACLAADKAGTTPSWLKPKAQAEAKVRLPDTPKGWERLDGCRLVDDKDRDGDSFYVSHAGREHRFRIYFANCPETDTRHDQHLGQAEHFGVDPGAVLEFGVKAKEFTKDKLSKPFTVYTKWQKAMGEQGASPRQYVMVFTVAGENLSQILVKAGLAWAKGEDADFPDAEGKRRLWKELNELEAEAKTKGSGIYRERNDFTKSKNKHALKPLTPPSKEEPRSPSKEDAAAQSSEAKAEAGTPAVQEPAKWPGPDQKKVEAPAQAPAKPLTNVGAQAETEVSAARRDAAGGLMVYVTKSGKKYHKDGCQSLKDSKIPKTLADAKSSGFEPCGQCNPNEIMDQ